MSGLFGVVSNNNCISSLYYGTDYHTHLGTEYGGIAFIEKNGMLVKKIRDIKNSQFKSKFYEGSDKIKSHLGIGVISDKDPQPLTFESKFGAGGTGGRQDWGARGRVGARAQRRGAGPRDGCH